jgi:hypothetical protein
MPERPHPRRLPALALAVLATVAGCGTGEEEIFDEIAAPGGAHSLRITVAKSRFPQGPWHVGVYLIARGEATGSKLIDTTLANDGVPFTSKNVAARWISPAQALICLRATDLPDRGLKIEVAEPPAVTEVDRC